MRVSKSKPFVGKRPAAQFCRYLLNSRLEYDLRMAALDADERGDLWAFKDLVDQYAALWNYIGTGNADAGTHNPSRDDGVAQAGA